MNYQGNLSLNYSVTIGRADWGYYTIVIQTVEIAISVAGILMNSVLLTFMPISKVNEKAKLYYTLVAVFDTVLLLLQIQYDHCDLYKQSCLSSMNLASCLLCAYFYKASELASSALLCCFSIERCIAILKPFAASALTYKRSQIAAATSVVLSFTLMVVSFPLMKIYAVEGLQFCWADQGLLGFVLYPLTLFMQEVLPALILCVTTAMLYYTLVTRGRRTELHKGSSVSQSVAEKGGVIVLIILSTLHVIGQLPLAIVWSASLWLQGPLNGVIFNLGFLFWAIAAVIHACNFPIYFFRVPSFREAVIRPCKSHE